jgi:phage terminase small subunit
MTKKQKLFVEHYNGNGTEAAQLAGYAGNRAVLAQTASDNLRKPDIRLAIDNRITDSLIPYIADRINRQRFWTKIMNDESIDTRDRLRASELLAKVDGDFIERKKNESTKTLEDLIMEAGCLPEEAVAG